MGNNSVPKFIFRLSRFPVYRGSVLGRFYCSWLLTFRDNLSVLCHVTIQKSDGNSHSCYAVLATNVMTDFKATIFTKVTNVLLLLW